MDDTEQSNSQMLNHPQYNLIYDAILILSTEVFHNRLQEHYIRCVYEEQNLQKRRKYNMDSQCRTNHEKRSIFLKKQLPARG